MLEENILSGLKVLRCLFQYPVDRLFPLNDLLRAIFYDPIVPLQIASWMWRADHVDVIYDVALPSTQVLKEPVVECKKILVS